MTLFGSVQTVILLFFCSLFRPHHCCTNQPFTCTSQSSTVRCHEDARCLKLHWTEMIPYAYLNATDPTTPHGILIGKLSNCSICSVRVSITMSKWSSTHHLNNTMKFDVSSKKAVGFERVLLGASHIELSGDQPQMHRQLWCTRVNKLFVFARIHCLVQS